MGALRLARLASRALAPRHYSGGAAMPPEVPLPVIDLRALDARNAGSAAGLAARTAALRALRAACEAPVGAFTAVTSSLVPPELVRRAYAQSRAFHALSDEAKQPFHHSRDVHARGWVPLLEEPSYEDGAVVSHVASFDLASDLPLTHPAVLAKVRGMGSNVYPPAALLPGFKEDVSALYAATTDAARLLFASLEAMLAIAPGTFGKHLTPTARGTMRLMQYPGTASAASADALNVGISAHSDFECCTLLHSDREGLQLSVGRDAASGGDDWRSAPVPDAAHFTVIMGDMLERWTNGTLRATRHRVAHVPWERLSLVRFVGVEGRTLVAPLPQFGAPRYVLCVSCAHRGLTWPIQVRGRHPRGPPGRRGQGGGGAARGQRGAGRRAATPGKAVKGACVARACVSGDGPRLRPDPRVRDVLACSTPLRVGSFVVVRYMRQRESPRLLTSLRCWLVAALPRHALSMQIRKRWVAAAVQLAQRRLELHRRASFLLWRLGCCRRRRRGLGLRDLGAARAGVGVASWHASHRVAHAQLAPAGARRHDALARRRALQQPASDGGGRHVCPRPQKLESHHALVTLCRMAGCFC